MPSGGHPAHRTAYLCLALLPARELTCAAEVYGCRRRASQPCRERAGTGPAEGRRGCAAGRMGALWGEM